MSFFVMGDIHGCYDDFISMLEAIEYNNSDDTLILIGDYIDRGSKSIEMVSWLMDNTGSRVIALKGNHEEEFIANIELLNQIDTSKELLEVCELLHSESKYFDTYGTIRALIGEHGYTLDDLNKWADFFKGMKLSYTRKIGGKQFAFVHAGYLNYGDYSSHEERMEFCLYARGKEAFEKGGLEKGITIFGHTPTIVKGEPTFKNGKIFCLHDKVTRKIFYDIDCGCAFKNMDSDAHLACLEIDKHSGEISYHYI